MTSILIVDDTPADAFKATQTLGTRGYQIAGVAPDAGTAISMARKHRPDIIIMDLILNDMNGLDVIKTIRDEFPEIIAILCSQSGGESIVDLAMRSGAAGYIVKPYQPEILRTCVQRALDRREQEFWYPESHTGVL